MLGDNPPTNRGLTDHSYFEAVVTFCPPPAHEVFSPFSFDCLHCVGSLNHSPDIFFAPFAIFCRGFFPARISRKFETEGRKGSKVSNVVGGSPDPSTLNGPKVSSSALQERLSPWDMETCGRNVGWSKTNPQQEIRCVVFATAMTNRWFAYKQPSRQAAQAEMESDSTRACDRTM